jgi:hypothetical protein
MSTQADARELCTILEKLRRRAQGSQGGYLYDYERDIKKANTLAATLKAAVERENK